MLYLSHNRIAMTEIFEPGWKAPENYWQRIKPTKTGLITFFALFYLPAIAYVLIMSFLLGTDWSLLWLVTSVLFKLIIALVVYHGCYFTASSLFHWLRKTTQNK